QYTKINLFPYTTLFRSKDLSLQDRGFEWVEYGQYKYINEIGFTHIPFHGYGPISGMAPCRKAAALTVKSVVFGHTHEGNWENYRSEEHTSELQSRENLV